MNASENSDDVQETTSEAVQPAEETTRKGCLADEDVEDLEADMRAACAAHRAAGGTFGALDYGISGFSWIVDAAGEELRVYCNKDNAPQDLIGVMIVGQVAKVSAVATMCDVCDLTSDEVDALEIGWHAGAYPAILSASMQREGYDARLIRLATRLYQEFCAN